MQAVQTTLIDYISANNLYTAGLFELAPAYDYITLQEFYTDHVLERTYHYYDCDCSACYAAHYPCENPDCDYCDSVLQLISEGFKRVKQDGGIIDYAEWNAWPMDYAWNNNDLRYSTCDGCGVLVNGYHRDTFDGYCSETCQEESEPKKYLCNHCEDQEVENDGDICELCSENSEHGYTIYIDDIEYWNEAWIAPDGDIYCVSDEHGGHDSAAKLMGFKGEEDCENHGYIHMSDSYSTQVCWMAFDAMTDEQAQVIIEICDIKEWDYPRFIKQWMDAHTVKADDISFEDRMEASKMQNLATSWLQMDRKTRDRFYPLSGD